MSDYKPWYKKPLYISLVTAAGTATLVGGTITVNNTSITANTRIFLTVSSVIGTQGFLSTTQIASTSFTINSTGGVLDNSIVNWLLIEPSP